MHRLLISLGVGLCGSLGILSAAYAVSDLSSSQVENLDVEPGSRHLITICESRVC